MTELRRFTVADVMGATVVRVPMITTTGEPGELVLQLTDGTLVLVDGHPEAGVLILPLPELYE